MRKEQPLEAIIEVTGTMNANDTKNSLHPGDWVYCQPIDRAAWFNLVHPENLYCFFVFNSGFIFAKVSDQKGTVLTLCTLNDESFDIDLKKCSDVYKAGQVVKDFENRN